MQMGIKSQRGYALAPRHRFSSVWSTWQPVLLHYLAPSPPRSRVRINTGVTNAGRQVASKRQRGGHKQAATARLPTPVAAEGLWAALAGCCLGYFPAAPSPRLSGVLLSRLAGQRAAEEWAWCESPRPVHARGPAARVPSALRRSPVPQSPAPWLAADRGGWRRRRRRRAQRGCLWTSANLG